MTICSACESREIVEAIKAGVEPRLGSCGEATYVAVNWGSKKLCNEHATLALIAGFKLDPLPAPKEQP